MPDIVFESQVNRKIFAALARLQRLRRMYS
jgi:hypothetical protein